MSNYSDSSFGEDSANTSWYKVYHLIPDNSMVLDVGCSSGNFGEVLVKKKNCTVDGLELDQQDFKLAQKKLRKVYNLNVETNDLNQITDKYDIIYFGDVIEHLMSPVTALKAVKTKLKKNGKVLFSIPNMAHISVRLLLLKGDFDYTETGLLDKTHLHFYTLDEVYRVFAEAGYKIDKIDFVHKDYPKALIEDWLKQAGLSANEEFYKLAKQPDAAAFQFVGTAQPSTTVKNKQRQQFGPIDLFDSFHNNTVNDLKNQLAAKDQQVQELVALRQQIEQLRRNPLKFVVRKAKHKLKQR